jgi:hypothetical protein
MTFNSSEESRPRGQRLERSERALQQLQSTRNQERGNPFASTLLFNLFPDIRQRYRGVPTFKKHLQ